MIFKCHGGIFKKSRRDESGISTRIGLAYPLQSMKLEDDWFILEYTSHSSPFLSQSIEIR